MSMGEPPPEAPLACHLCGLPVPASGYAAHLRAEHRQASYRGITRGLPETLEAVRFDLLADPPSAAAWLAVQGIAREEQGDGADEWLAGWLATALGRLSPERLAAVAGVLAALVAPEGTFLEALAHRPEPAARRVALEAVSLLPSPLAPALIGPLRGLMYERAFGEAAQARIAAASLRDPLGDGLSARMLRWLTAKVPPEDAVRRLRAVGKLAGEHPLLRDALARKMRGMAQPCPRCGTALTREEMEKHLWLVHRLLLDGDDARDPWDMVRGWARLYRSKGDLQILQRCRAAAARLDPVHGGERLERLLLATGAAEPAARQAWLRKAREMHAGCCPWCYALVPVPQEVPALEVNLRPDRLSAGGYEAELGSRGLRSRLVVQMPALAVFDGQEPGQSFTALGAAIAWAGPIVGLALLAACLWPVAWLGKPLPTVAFLLMLSGLVGLFAWLLARPEKPPEARVLGHAWNILVPKLNLSRFDVRDSAFAAGLARLCSRLERTDVPPGPLRTQLQLVSEALERREAPPGHLAALCRLEAELAAARGEDPVALVERWAARCFDGKLPLAFSQALLEEWATAWWTPGLLARLRVRLCDRAFEAGFEVQGLIDAGRNAPALGAALGTGDPRGLAALRVVWSLRPSRPWEKLGDARTAFELAAEPGRVALFEAHPGALLWQEVRDSLVAVEGGEGPMRAATVVLTLEGVWVQGELFAAPPRVFEVRRRPDGAELRLDGRVFRSPSDLEPLSRLLEKWFRLGFHEVLPQVERAQEWVSPDRAALMRAWGAVPCGECGRHFLPRVGDVGMGLEQEAAE